MSSFCHGQAVLLYPQIKYDIEYIEMNPEMKTNLRKGFLWQDDKKSGVVKTSSKAPNHQAFR